MSIRVNAPKCAALVAVSASLAVSGLIWAPGVAAAPGIVGFLGTQVSKTSDTTVFFGGNNISEIQSLEFGCSGAGQPVITPPAAEVDGSGDAVGQVTVTSAMLADVASGSTCVLTAVVPTGGGAKIPYSDTSKDFTLYVRDAAVAVGVPSPDRVESAFPPDQAPRVTLSAQGGGDLTQATSVQEVLCSGNPVGIFPTTGLSVSASSITFAPMSLPAQSCAIMVEFADGSTILAPATTGGPQKALTYAPWYSGPLTVTIVNTSDTPDDDLWVSFVGKGSGTVSGFDGFNIETLTTRRFTELVNLDGSSTYQGTSSATGGSASFQIRQPVDSGVVYLAGAEMASGSPPPNPVTSTVRYAMAELTYDTSLYTDLTLIDQVGYAMSSTLYSDAGRQEPLTDSHRTTGCLADLVDAIKKKVPAESWSRANADGTGGVIRYAGPTSQTIVGYVGAAKKPAAYMQSSVEGYVKYVEGIAPLTIQDEHNAKYQKGAFDYTATYDSGTDLWTLEGTIENGAQQGPVLTVEGSSIYSQGSNGGTGYAMYGEDGPFRVEIGSKSFGWGNGGQVQGTTYQDLVKTIYRDFIAGFAYGYWGGAYGGGVDTGKDAVNFTRDPRTSAYSHAGVPDGRGAWNQYDEVIRSVTSGGGGASGAYGTAYSDTFLPAGLSPAIGTYFAQNWTITLGDPSSCRTPPTPVPANLAPSPQHVKVDVGTPIATAELTASGFPGPVTYSISPALPTSLTLNPATGQITGTPTVPQTTVVYTITGISDATKATAQVSIKVGTDPTPPNPSPTPIDCPPPGFVQDGQCLEPA